MNCSDISDYVNFYEEFYPGYSYLVSAKDGSSTSAYQDTNFGTGSDLDKHLTGLKYNFIAGEGSLQDLTAIFHSMADPTLPSEEKLVVNSGTGSSLTTMACPAGKRINAMQFGYGPMSGTSAIMAIASVADGGLGISVAPSDSVTGTSSYIDGPECRSYIYS